MLSWCAALLIAFWSRASSTIEERSIYEDPDTLGYSTEPPDNELLDIMPAATWREMEEDALR